MSDKSLKILLADDDEADRLLFTDAFIELNSGITIETVNDGMALMDLLHATETEDLAPDTVFGYQYATKNRDRLSERNKG
jgi:CheY-like chemotaxis protein